MSEHERGREGTVEVEWLDATAAVLDEPRREFLAAAKGFLKIGRLHRTHLPTGRGRGEIAPKLTPVERGCNGGNTERGNGEIAF